MSEFVPNQKGLNELFNSGGMQQVCLGRARSVASIAGGAIGRAIPCDVRPGKTRAHARASIEVPFEGKGYYGADAPNIKDEMAKAARAVGGS